MSGESTQYESQMAETKTGALTVCDAVVEWVLVEALQHHLSEVAGEDLHLVLDQLLVQVAALLHLLGRGQRGRGSAILSKLMSSSADLMPETRLTQSMGLSGLSWAHSWLTQSMGLSGLSWAHSWRT